MYPFHCQPMYHPFYHGYGYPVRQLDMISLTNNHRYLNRQYPDVDPTLFEQSAKSMQKLMREASLILDRFAQSKPFAQKVMYAAKQSNMKEVERLIKSTGIKSEVETSFNPDGINLKLSARVGGSECCHLTIALRWM
ncbi:hypothetical protein [Bacillus sp. SA1-12]|uniref:hypothetical protein n=1 Tax=Bacillus sp. SA1-12 TaxID=1455638 RepID=UPI000AAD8580|nr:hypothetical protein [Bacillus sp. SA1-12]